MLSKIRVERIGERLDCGVLENVSADVGFFLSMWTGYSYYCNKLLHSECGTELRINEGFCTHRSVYYDGTVALLLIHFVKINLVTDPFCSNVISSIFKISIRS